MYTMINLLYMDPVKNPFSPGAGAPPPELVGRDGILTRADISLRRIREGRHAKSNILVGLRGVGKTVLLNRIRENAETAGFRPILIEAHEGKSLPELLLPPLRQILFSLDALELASDKVRRGFRVLRSFFNGVKVKAGDVEFQMGISPEKGIADSGDLESDLADVFTSIGEAAADRGTAIVLLIDELQYLSEKELSALIMALHRVSQRGLPLVLVGAGLPQIVGLAGRSKSYAERLFDFPEVGPLNEGDAKEALQGPASSAGAAFSGEALNQIVRVTEGYPYFLQQWGSEAWNLAQRSTITLADACQATTEAISNLDGSFFRVRFDRLTPREKEYLHILAILPAERHRSADVAERLGVSLQSAAPVRNSLIKKGMIYSPAHGNVAFTVPMFDAFLLRAMGRPA